MIENFIHELSVNLAKNPKSKKWKHWIAQIDLKTCESCRTMHGKIYPIKLTVSGGPPLHLYCRCEIKPMSTVNSGECSKEGRNGADWWLVNKNALPNYYISKDELLAMGWYYGKQPAKYAPGKMVFGGIFRNDEGLLPEKPGRVWFEVDLNYYSGSRNGHRLLWSNDGLFFATYDHYRSFIEVLGG